MKVPPGLGYVQASLAVEGHTAGAVEAAHHERYRRSAGDRAACSRYDHGATRDQGREHAKRSANSHLAYPPNKLSENAASEQTECSAGPEACQRNRREN